MPSIPVDGLAIGRLVAKQEPVWKAEGNIFLASFPTVHCLPSGSSSVSKRQFETTFEMLLVLTFLKFNSGTMFEHLA